MMEQTLILWKLELKRTIKQLPCMLVEAVLLLAVLSAAALGAVKFLYQDSSVVQVSVAVVEEDENPLTDLVINYVQGMESISGFCRFLVVSEEEGFSMLQDGKAAAVLVLPDKMVEGIISGENMPVQIFFPKNAGIESALLKELTDAGVQMLRVAQAEIYGIYDTVQKYDAMEQLSVLEADIDRYNLAFALDRMALFQTQEVSATGSLSILQYGIASGATFFLLLLGMSCYSVMKPYPVTFRGQLLRQGVGVGRQCFGKWLCGLCSMGVCAFCFYILVKMVLRGLGYDAWMPPMGGRQLGCVFLVLLCITTYVFLVFRFANSGTTAILLFFFLSTVMTYCSGGFMPSVFLPEAVRKIGQFLPTTYLIEAMGSLYLGKIQGKTIGMLLLYTCIFGLTACGIRKEDGA